MHAVNLSHVSMYCDDVIVTYAALGKGWVVGAQGKARGSLDKLRQAVDGCVLVVDGAALQLCHNKLSLID